MSGEIAQAKRTLTLDRFKKGETVVVIFHDHGTRYVGKMFNPDWMKKMGYETVPGPTARELIRNKQVADVVDVMVDDTIEQAVERSGTKAGNKVGGAKS